MVKFTACVLLALCCSGPVFAACDKPEPPEIPDPNTAVTAQMVKAQNDVKAFVAAAEDYLKCERNNFKADKMVEEMKTVADDFNKSIRAYKERMGAS